MPPLPTRTCRDRFGDTWRVHTGPTARRLRREIRREQDEALARSDAAYRRLAFALDHDTFVLPALIAFCEADEAFRSIADTEAEIARRAEQREAA